MARRAARAVTAAWRARGRSTAAAAVLAFSLLVQIPQGHGADPSERVDVHCRQAEPLTLECDYRLRESVTLRAARLELDEVAVEGRRGQDYPGPGDSTAVLILVDTSDPARRAVVERNAAQVAELAAAAGLHHRLGLAAFDTELTVLAPLGSTADEIRAQASGLRASGRTTELFRNVREAVRLLAASPYSRKALVLFSDGLAEDFAYHHEDVVAAARAGAVIIHTLGYPRSVAQSVALQTLRRLSDETGGLYAQAAGTGFELPAGVLARLLAATDSGGTLRFDLAPLQAAGHDGTVDARLALQIGGERVVVSTPVLLPRRAATVAVPPAPAAPAPPAAPPSIPSPPPAAGPTASTLGWWALGALVLAALAALRVRRRPAARRAPAPSPVVKPLAFLILADARQTRHAVERTPWRIGRGSNNDLVLDDHSVSRLHAELRAGEDGQLLLHDLDSLNGVFVNDDRIHSAPLREGDRIEIGDVRMVFTHRDESYASQDATVLVSTRAPS